MKGEKKTKSDPHPFPSIPNSLIPSGSQTARAYSSLDSFIFQTTGSLCLPFSFISFLIFLSQFYPWYYYPSLPSLPSLSSLLSSSLHRCPSSLPLFPLSFSVLSPRPSWLLDCQRCDRCVTALSVTLSTCWPLSWRLLCSQLSPCQQVWQECLATRARADVLRPRHPVGFQSASPISTCHRVEIGLSVHVCVCVGIHFMCGGVYSQITF